MCSSKYKPNGSDLKNNNFIEKLSITNSAEFMLLWFQRTGVAQKELLVVTQFKEPF